MKKFNTNHVYSTRVVEFTLYPKQDVEAAFEIFVDTLETKFLSRHDNVFEIGHWPWWVPKSFACRRVAKVANDALFWGDAVYKIEYTSFIGEDNE